MATPKGRPALVFRVVVVATLALVAVALAPQPLEADQHDTVRARVVNGTAGSSAPVNLEVTLHSIGRDREVYVTAALTNGLGEVQFYDVEVDSQSLYTLATKYQGVPYSRTVDATALAQPVELSVYETSRSLESVVIGTDVMLLVSAQANARKLLALQVVAVENAGDHTIVPDLANPAAMSFLRFGLPVGATTLEVSSDLPDGEIINVGSGFALTAPIPPGRHQVTYGYRLSYKGSRLELARSFPMGAESFRLLLGEATGRVEQAGHLSPLSPVTVETSRYQVWGAGPLVPGAEISVALDGLPQPAWSRRVLDALSSGKAVTVGIPSAVGAVLAGLLVYALVLRRPQAGLQASTATPDSMSAPGGTGPEQVP